MTATTTTGPLSAAGATGVLALTGVATGLQVTATANQTGSGAIPVYAGPVGTAVGIYLTVSDNANLDFAVYRHPTAWHGGAPDVGALGPQKVLGGDDKSIRGAGLAPLAWITAADSVSIAVPRCAAGSLTMSVVQ